MYQAQENENENENTNNNVNSLTRNGDEVDQCKCGMNVFEKRLY